MQPNKLTNRHSLKNTYTYHVFCMFLLHSSIIITVYHWKNRGNPDVIVKKKEKIDSLPISSLSQ